MRTNKHQEIKRVRTNNEFLENNPEKSLLTKLHGQTQK
jgi:hypothetical protein